MSPDDRNKVAIAGADATAIAAICEMIARSLHADPDMEPVGFALEGLGTLAARLSAKLCALAEPTD